MSAADPMSEREYRRIIQRQRYFPTALRAAEEKLRLLRIEAHRLGMDELLRENGEDFKFTTTSPVASPLRVVTKESRP